MSWSISGTTLLALIKGMSETEKILFTNYQALRRMVKEYSDYTMGIDECKMYKNYFHNLLQDTSSISDEITQMEQLILILQKKIEELEGDILRIEQSIWGTWNIHTEMHGRHLIRTLYLFIVVKFGHTFDLLLKML